VEEVNEYDRYGTYRRGETDSHVFQSINRYTRGTINYIAHSLFHSGKSRCNFAPVQTYEAQYWRQELTYESTLAYEIYPAISAPTTSVRDQCPSIYGNGLELAFKLSGEEHPYVLFPLQDQISVSRYYSSPGQWRRDILIGEIEESKRTERSSLLCSVRISLLRV
jgi:hypothetical protein